MNISEYKINGKQYYNVFVNQSYTKGILHFSHEISINLDDKLNFIEAYEIACEDINYTSEEEFEIYHKGLLDKIRKEIKESGRKN